MIKALYLRNVGPFRGEHRIELGPGAYAMVARHALDARRSNGLGKSMLAAAIRFCVTGQWPRRYGDADGWISTGEREAIAALFLEDGTAVERKKIRGKAREARAKTPGTGWKPAFNDDATTAMIRHLGLESAEEFSETCYVGQKRADAFMVADPSTRLSIVSGWLGLGSAERAVERATDDLEAMTASVDKAVAERDRLRALASEETFDPEPIKAKVLEERETAKTIGDNLSVVMKGLASLSSLSAHDERIERGKKARKLADENPPPTDAEVEAAEQAVALAESEQSAARKEVVDREEVAAGQFSGKCPVAARACPVTAEINADRLTAKKQLEKALARRAAARTAVIEARAVLDPLERRMAEHGTRQHDIRKLREEVRESASARAEDLKAVAAATNIMTSMSAPDLRTACSKIQDDLRDASRSVGLLEGEVMAIESAQRRQAEARALLADAEARVEAAIAKRKLTADASACARAAQRRVAERALSAIEIGANEALAEAGVDVRLRARWEREGKDLARHCEACGASFPTSRKVKECLRCGAPRGLNLVQRLDLVADGSSDGLDDLAGVAWQHAAAGWLLHARQSPWSTCILDEPTAHLDHPSRQGLVRYLGSAMRRGVVRQTIVISHSQETTESLGKKIVITCAANGERRIEVM